MFSNFLNTICIFGLPIGVILVIAIGMYVQVRNAQRVYRGRVQNITVLDSCTIFEVVQQDGTPLYVGFHGKTERLQDGALIEFRIDPRDYIFRDWVTEHQTANSKVTVEHARRVWRTITEYSLNGSLT